MMHDFVHWIQSKDESTRRGFVALCTSVSFLMIFFGWLAFNPFAGLRPQSSPAAEVAGEQTDRTATPAPRETASPDPSRDTAPFSKQVQPSSSPDQLPLDLSGIATPDPGSNDKEVESPSDTTVSNPLFIPQDNVSSTPEL